MNLMKSNKSFDISNSFKRLDYNYDSTKITKRNLGFGPDNINMNMNNNHEQINNNNILNQHSINIQINNNINNNNNENENFLQKKFNFPCNNNNNNNFNGNFLKINENISNLPKNNKLLMSSEDEKLNLEGKNNNKNQKTPEKANKEKNTIFSFDKINDKPRKNKLNSLLEKVSLIEEKKLKANDFTSIDKKLDQMKR